ncbi:MAG: 4Fe-4S binding protein [Deltaproteobacteria bacterium]|nr:4Fe-4S binding protein [Deltaproteobacteria bacterium]MBW2138791.1 4Fe-4S binding protein [Deltaproteobacteria bacterium]
MAKKTRKGKIVIDRELCKGCHICIHFCPNKLIAVSEKLNKKGYHPAEFVGDNVEAQEKHCTGCTMCAIVCPDVAIEVYRE